MGKRKNSLLQEPGTKVEFTEEMINELYKCKQNPIYFANKYCYIVHPQKGKIKLNLRDYQDGFIETIHNNKSIISLQPRQVGKCVGKSNTIKLKDNQGETKELSIEEFFKEI